MTENKRAVGDRVEKECVKFLLEQGVRDIATNFRCRIGEVDIIGYDGIYLTFFEVKYRKNLAAGYAEEAVSLKKQIIISKVAAFYLAKYGLGLDTPVRFDVLAVNGNKINWYKNAFDYAGGH